MDRFRTRTYQRNRRTRIFVLFAWPGLREKFIEVRNAGDETDFLEYLNSLRRVLEKPFPKRREVEKYVPTGYGVKSKYLELLDNIGEIPEDESSRKILIRMAGGCKYQEYRERTEEALEHLNILDDFLRRNMLDGETEDQDERFIYSR
ncbi:hypothetical protein AKJ66_01815 [candidate division MSBL1 archaeon SCGC-AAA259E22]|uniref:Uncharacterized protein n=1 Tax=candidate division MSBL1 archaeon SCGC-AAA259E22 TaxID=1698265 RepID=A0A133UHE1_9EURY|nr:hypothetical protein AKJ66_01815 [candidate division MSBL1 archaeon SCGC-AAA259E22]